MRRIQNGNLVVVLAELSVADRGWGADLHDVKTRLKLGKDACFCVCACNVLSISGA